MRYTYIFKYFLLSKLWFLASYSAGYSASSIAANTTLKQLQNVFVDIQTITTLAANEAAAKKINEATNGNAGETEKALDDQFDYQQARAGIPEKDRASVHLYQGDDATFDDNPKAGDLRNYKGGYNKSKNEVYLNTQRTNIDDGSDIQRVLFTELQRKETRDSKLLSQLNEKQQKALAYDRGDRGAKMWERFSNPSTKTDPAVVRKWNEENASKLSNNNARISQVDGKQVKPRMDMERDPLMRKFFATKSGGKIARSFIPVVGSGEVAIDAFKEKKYVQGSLHTALALVEVIPLVSWAKSGVKLMGTAGKLKKLGSPVVGQAANQMGSVGLKVGTSSLISLKPQLSKHAIGRMAERGITPKMVSSVFKHGQRFYDPKNNSINYLLQGGFGSGKDLLMGVDILNSHIKTVLRGTDLLKPRMIPLK